MFHYIDILKIDNLWQFKSLVKLQLDNNIVEKIEGLDTLVNLVWLGESSNNFDAHTHVMLYISSVQKFGCSFAQDKQNMHWTN